MGWRVHTPPVHQVAYGTPVGALETASLADGSEATLSRDSRIVVALSRSERRIDLQRGAAFFHPTRDAQRPFVVAAAAHRVDRTRVLSEKASAQRVNPGGPRT